MEEEGNTPRTLTVGSEICLSSNNKQAPKAKKMEVSMPKKTVTKNIAQ